MKPSSTLYEEDKFYKEFPTEKFFFIPKDNFLTSLATPHCV